MGKRPNASGSSDTHQAGEQADAQADEQAYGVEVDSVAPILMMVLMMAQTMFECVLD